MRPRRPYTPAVLAQLSREARSLLADAARADLDDPATLARLHVRAQRVLRLARTGRA